jgi:cysteine synthase A
MCDSNKKHLSLALLRDEPVRPGYLASEIGLVGYHPSSRLAAPYAHVEA